MRHTVAFLLVAASFPALAAELPTLKYGLSSLTASAKTLEVAPIDAAKAVEEDIAAQAEGGPVRYGVPQKQPLSFAPATKPGAGKRAAAAWQKAGDGLLVTRVAFHAEGATSLDFGFAEMHLPQGAELWIASPDGSHLQGPYTDADNTRFGGFYTPIVPGEDAVVEVVVPESAKDALKLELGTVTYGYRDIFTLKSPYAKSGSCNVDTACAAADPYRDQVNAVARYTFSGALCTGQLLNNTAQNRRRLFSTANHCVSDQTDANSMVLYWKYESPVCRTPRSSQSGTPIPVNGNSIAQTGGATLLMTYEPPDTALVELNTAIPTQAQPFWDGWDRREVAPSRTAVIHHPAGDEKRIALDNDPAVLINSNATNVPGSQHWRVIDYNLGTTEGGSSGSGLLNPDKRVIGFLSGGTAACAASSSEDPDNDGDNGLDDYYGRLSAAWEGGGTAGTRLRDWLDPAATGANTVDGTGTCASPTTATLTAPATGSAGVPVSYSVGATGGTGPYTVAWDIDGDGITDRIETSANGSATISAQYPTATSTNVRVTVTNSQGCSDDDARAIDVSAPDLVATPGTPFQVCGDSDVAIEPGERWSVPVTLNNAGGRALDGGLAVFARAGGASGAGYVQSDSSQAGGACGYQFVDTSSQPVSLTPAYNNAGREDEGITAPIALGPGGFSFFGETLTSVVMSTNGYLSTSADDTGGDFDNDCPVDAVDQGGDGGRFHVLHDDLVIQSGGAMRTQRYASCPRASAVSPGVGCTVFTWANMGQYQGTSTPVGNAEFQAILYDTTNEIVYQYKTPDPASGGEATVGIQNADLSQVTQRGCDTAGQAPANRAVCFFAPGQVPAALAPASTRLLTPAVALNNLASAQSQTVNATFQVATSAACGAAVGLDYVGTVDNRAYSMRNTSILQTTLGAGGGCQVFNGTCAAVPAELGKRDGLYSSTNRFGNGIGSFNIPSSGQTIFGGQWYTGTQDRSPTWLILQGPVADNQADVPIYRFRKTAEQPFAVASTIVGQAQISYTSTTDYVATWIVDGRRGGEKMTWLYGANRPTPNRTGSWLYPAESGWGVAVDDHVLNGQPDSVLINYFYDGANNPIWTLGGGSPPGAGTQQQNLFRVHCPNCASITDFNSDAKPAGTVTYNFSAPTSGTYSTNIQFPAPFTGSWIRNNVPVQLLSPPATQAGDAAAGDVAKAQN